MKNAFIKKIVFLISGMAVFSGLICGCAPKQAYTSADALGRTSSKAREAAVSARRTAGETDATRNKMVNDINSIKEAEKLFDEQSGITLSY